MILIAAALTVPLLIASFAVIQIVLNDIFVWNFVLLHYMCIQNYKGKTTPIYDVSFSNMDFDAC